MGIHPVMGGKGGTGGKGAAVGGRHTITNERGRQVTTKEKRVFIKDLVRNVQADLLKNRVGKMPAEWDGHEIRQYIADLLAESSYSLKRMPGRYREYKNTVAVTGGL